MQNPDSSLKDAMEREGRGNYLSLIMGVAILFGLYLTSLYSYLFFHSLAELFSILIAFGIFVIAWNSRPFLGNNYLLLVGIAYLFVGSIDLLHTLAYKGMGVFNIYDADHPTQLWIAARYMQSISLLIAPFFVERRLNHRTMFVAYAVAFSLILWSIFVSNVFPVCYVNGIGLTPFKKNSEYVISFMLLLSGGALLRKRTFFDRRVLFLILLSIGATIVSELAFTFYVGVYDFSNLVGHLFKIISFYLIYLAIIKTGIRDPFDIIFRNLKQQEQELREAKEGLDLRVAERTAELAKTNRVLKTLSECNQTLIRATDEEGLTKDVCRIITENGGYRLAWVGYAENDDSKSVRPAAWAGVEDGYLSTADITWADTERGRGPSGTAIRRGEIVYIGDFTTDPIAAPWRESALERGYRSSIALPLKDERGTSFGVLNIYSSELSAFTPDEIRLLEELAGDLAFGVIVLRARKERRRAERSIVLMNFALNNVREAAFLTDETAHFQYVNEEACRIMGYTRDELLKLSVVDIDPDFPVERWPGHWAELKAGHSLTFEGRYRAKDGRIFPVEISANYFEYNGRGYNLELVRDITWRKQTEEAIRTSEEKFAKAFHSSPNLMAITTPEEGRIIEINDAYCRVLGYQREECVGRTTAELRVWADAGQRKSIAQKIREEGYVRNVEADLRKKSGEISSVVLSMEPITIKDKEYFLSVATDITERKQAEEKMAQLHEKVKEEAEVSKSLLEIVETLNTSLDERELIRNVISLAPHYLRFGKAAIYLYDEEMKSFIFAGGYGFSLLEEGTLVSRTLKKGDFPAFERILSGETIIIDSAKETDLLSREMVETFNTGSAIIVPACFREKMIGAIEAQYESKGPVTEKDVALLKGLADGIAIAIQNSRLYRESVERLMQLSGKMETIKTMAQLDQEILSSIDRVSILRTATALINRAIPCDRAAIILRDGDSFRVVSEWGLGEFQNRAYPVKGSHIEAFERNRISVYLNDLGSGDCDYHKEQESIGIKSALLIPLAAKEGTIGFLDIGSVHQGRLTPEHLSAAESISTQISVALENARLYEELQHLLIGTITSLSSAIDAKSPWTKGHSERVTKYALEIGKEMGLEDKDLDNLRLAGLLHDVGKIGTYDVLLDKLEKFTAEEFEIVKKHPGKGAEILSPIKQLGGVIPGILHHHERMDGKGYPERLSGEEIPLCARILCVADSFDAMTADRPYRAAPGKEYAISELRRCCGTQFDPTVIEAFLRVLNRPER